MARAGINTKHFSAHSTRGVAISRAKSVGMSTKDILKAATGLPARPLPGFINSLYGSEFGHHMMTARSTFTFGRYHVVGERSEPT